MEQIKRSYRELARKYHPDRHIQSSPSLKVEAETKFAEISAAYALLTDPPRKAQYDHIYKYGGFDNKENPVTADTAKNHQQNRKTGIGYTCTDPFAFIWSQGRVKSTKTIAGVQIPSRATYNMGGIRMAFSSGKYIHHNGTHKYVCRTMEYADGKKYTRTETTILHPDGRREVIPDSPSDDFTVDTSTPWYMNAWTGIRDRLVMCHNPCAYTVD